MPKYPPHPLLQQPLEDMLKGDYLEPEDYTTSNKLIDVRIVIRIMEAMLVLKKDWPDKFAFFDPRQQTFDCLHLKWYYGRGDIDKGYNRNSHIVRSSLVILMHTMSFGTKLCAATVNWDPTKFFNYQDHNALTKHHITQLAKARRRRLEPTNDPETEPDETDSEQTTRGSDRETALLHFVKAARALKIIFETGLPDARKIETPDQIAHLFHQIMHPYATCNDTDEPPCAIKIRTHDAIRIMGTLANNKSSAAILKQSDKKLLSQANKFELYLQAFPFLPLLYKPILTGLTRTDFGSLDPAKTIRYPAGTLGSVLRMEKRKNYTNPPSRKLLIAHPEKLFESLYGPDHEAARNAAQSRSAKKTALISETYEDKTALHIAALGRVDENLGKTNGDNGKQKSSDKGNIPEMLRKASLFSPSDAFRAFWYEYSRVR